MKIFYASGPGNVIGTYRFFRAGEHDPSQIAITYSGQFFEVCRKFDVADRTSPVIGGSIFLPSVLSAVVQFAGSAPSGASHHFE